MSATELGTLMWIGTTTEPEFEAAFDYCRTHAAQLAIRKDITEACRRPAAAVHGILLARPDRTPVDPAAWGELMQAYPEAAFLSLLGTHCEGMKADALDAKRLYWHRWREVIPPWLARFGSPPASNPRDCRCVAVVASHYAAAEALLELAESTGAATVWLPDIDTLRVRNVDAVWWDDSVAGPTTAEGWSRRIAAFSNPIHEVRHGWIVSAPRYDEHRAATQAGIELIASKPYRIENLLQMLGSDQAKETLKLRAA